MTTIAPKDRQASTRATRLGRIAVVGRYGVTVQYEDGPRWILEGRVPSTIHGAHHIATAHGVSQMWWHEEALAYSGLPLGLQRARGGWAENRHEFTSRRGDLKVSADGLRPWLSASGISWRDEWTYLECAFPGWEDRNPEYNSPSPWARTPSSEALLAALVAFQEATGTPWKMSGAITSDHLLREHWRRSKVTLGHTAVPPPAEDARLEPDLSWHRAPEGAELRANYCHAIDLHAMYLGACSSLALPEGEPLHEPGPAYPPPVPGYWKLEALGEREDRRLLPPAAPLGPTWITTPTLQLLRDEGFDPDITEGYWWPNHHRYLEPWYKTLRDARTRLLEGPTPALAALKQTYQQGVGRLGSTRRSNEHDPLYQPYWRHAVQAEARCRLWRRLASLPQAPVAVDVDCAWYLTGSPSAGAFAVGKLRAPVGDGIGQFHHEGSLPGKVAREILNEERSKTVVAALRDYMGAMK